MPYAKYWKEIILFFKENDISICKIGNHGRGNFTYEIIYKKIYYYGVAINNDMKLEHIFNKIKGFMRNADDANLNKNCEICLDDSRSYSLCSNCYQSFCITCCVKIIKNNDFIVCPYCRHKRNLSSCPQES